MAKIMCFIKDSGEGKLSKVTPWVPMLISKINFFWVMSTYFLKVFVREKCLRTVRRRNVPRVRTAVMPSIH